MLISHFDLKYQSYAESEQLLNKSRKVHVYCIIIIALYFKVKYNKIF